MSIAIQRIERAIADMQKGCMQTGKQTIKLEYSDAQRAIAELTDLQRRNAELVAQVEALRETSITAANTLGFLSHHLRGRMGEAALMDMAEKADEIKFIVTSTPSQCLQDIKAEAGRAGYIAGYEGGHMYRFANLADEYAAKIAGGE